MKEQRSRLLLGILVITILTLSFAVPFMSVQATSVFAEPIIAVEGSLNKVFVLPLTFINGALPPDNGIGFLVASIIIIAFATRNEIERVISTVRRRLIFGHHPGPPAFFVSLTRWARVSVIAAIAELIDNLINFTSKYNRYKMVVTDIRVKLALSGELRTVSGDRNIHTFNTLKVWT